MKKSDYGCVCKRCGHKWVSVSLMAYNLKPCTCPKCKSYIWETPKSGKYGNAK